MNPGQPANQQQLQQLQQQMLQQQMLQQQQQQRAQQLQQAQQMQQQMQQQQQQQQQPHQQQQQQIPQQMAQPKAPSNTATQVLETQFQGITSLLQSLERLEQAGDKFFQALELVGQGPPSLLTAHMESMGQICKQMQDTAWATKTMNVPVSGDSPELYEKDTGRLPRIGGLPVSLESQGDLENWVQDMVGQTGNLFAERRRLAANVQAALSVPPPKRLDLQ